MLKKSDPDSQIREMLNLIKSAGGSIHWSDGDIPPHDFSEVIRLGYARRDDGSGWSAMEGVKLTKAGLALVGPDAAV